MKTFFLTVSTPLGNAYEGEAAMLSLRGSEGDLAILPGHIPFSTGVMAGKVKIVTEEEEEKLFRTDGGLLAAAGERVTLLAGTFEPAEDEEA